MWTSPLVPLPHLTLHEYSLTHLSIYLSISILYLSLLLSLTLSLSSSLFPSSSVYHYKHTKRHEHRYNHHIQKQAQHAFLIFELVIVWMDPSSGQHQQMSSQSLENKKPRPQPEQALKCPRCDSTNTKFCYYNNYSLSQPRYFCKSCRRYWTKGGTLRNVPVGGGCRKNKRSSSSSSSSSSSKRAQEQAFTPNSNPLTGLPHLSYDSSDLTLALARLQKQSCGLGFDDHDLSILGNPTSSLCDILGSQGLNHTSTNTGFLEALRSGFQGTQNNNSTLHHHQNLYYSYGNGDMGEVVDNGNNSCGVGVSGEMMLPNYDHEISNAATQAVSVTTMKQEMCSGREHMMSESSRVFGGIPWHHINNGDTNMGEIDSARASWNNGFTSNWQGLLHSPLM